MDHHNIINTLGYGEKVTSTYADVYFENDYCQSHKPKENSKEVLKSKASLRRLSLGQYDWKSPSDQLIDIIKLTPPFTSKITRGKAHEGLLAIGNKVLENESAKFYRTITNLLLGNNTSWEYIMKNEKKAIIKKVENIFENIFKEKRDIMSKEISLFYENSLSGLEENLKSEIRTVLQSTHANVVSNLNYEIEIKLNTEKNKLDHKLNNKYIIEIGKVKEYYNLLLNNEQIKHKKIVNNALQDRNDALKAYYKIIEAEKITSAMYILSLERKKCTIKKMLLEKYQSSELSEKLKNLKEKQGLLDIFKGTEAHLSIINKEWETKIKNILQIFLKFISFALKLLPEQTTFLLDLEKMLVLQLNEIQKNPTFASSILVDEDEQENIFKFYEAKIMELICEKDPFTLIGDLTEDEPPKYGSRETLKSDVELTHFRIRRQFVYAKCHGYEDIKKLLEAQSCKCYKSLSVTHTELPESKSIEFPKPQASFLENNSSSNEELFVEDIQRFQECPVRKCGKWIQRNPFPYLPSYLDFSEDNFQRVKTMLTNIPPKNDMDPVLINPKYIAYKELPFSVTKELTKTVETQYSSQEDLTQIPCSCTYGVLASKSKLSQHIPIIKSEYNINEILTKRKISLNRLLQEHPKLLELLSDERFDYKL